MIPNPSKSEARRDELVASLQKSGALSNIGIARAFLAVPREVFIPHFYERIGRDWIVRHQDGSEQWLDAIYQDDALATEINQQNLPVSSSSRPSVMAQMLEELDVQPGQKVLEVGTGTAYNAALLATLTGSPGSITTIDIDAHLVAHALLVLHEHIGPVNVYHGDGRQGVSTMAPFDRVIATASSSYIPKAWYDQLAPGGRLVMPLEGSLQAGGFLVIEKDQDSARGRFRPEGLSFMPLRSDANELLPYTQLPPAFSQLPITGKMQIEAGDPVLASLNDKQFKWFLQFAWPQAGELRINSLRSPEGKQGFRIHDPQYQSLLRLEELLDGSWQGKVQGEFPLWAKIRQIYQTYAFANEPEYGSFWVDLDAQKAMLMFPGDLCFRDLYISKEHKNS